MDRIHVMVVSNREKIDVPTFYKTSTIANHEDLLRDFYKNYNLKLPDNFYADLIDKGAIVILTFNKKMVIFVPKVISQEQLEILKSYQQFFSTFEEIDLGIFKEELLELSYNKKDNPNMLEDFYKVIKENIVESQVRIS